MAEHTFDATEESNVTNNPTDVAADRDEHTVKTEAQVVVPADTWARIYELTLREIEQGEDPEFAWRDAVDEYIQVTPVPVIEGEGRRTLEDVSTSSAEATFDTVALDEIDGEPRCPRCGEPISSATVSGPGEAVVEPCGHTVPAAALPDPGSDSSE